MNRFSPCEIIASPVNYTGGKSKLLPQLLPLFPEAITTFVDLFAGGCNVGANVCADRIIFNELSVPVSGLFDYFYRTPEDRLFADVERIISRFKLSRTDLNGYFFYGCNSSGGLAAYNRIPFLQLRDTFNRLDPSDDTYFPMLYVLIVYSFNNQIRFNSSGRYNLPVGKRDFNISMQKKLAGFINRLKHLDVRFATEDFRDFKTDELDANGFVYADPPYLITCASYNERNGWNPVKETALLEYLDMLHSKGIRFALSNVLSESGKSNEILGQWIEDHTGSYFVHTLAFDYSNANYHKKNKQKNTQEILITNYRSCRSV